MNVVHGKFEKKKKGFDALISELSEQAGITKDEAYQKVLAHVDAMLGQMEVGTEIDGAASFSLRH